MCPELAPQDLTSHGYDIPITNSPAASPSPMPSIFYTRMRTVGTKYCLKFHSVLPMKNCGLLGAPIRPASVDKILCAILRTG